MSKNVNSKFKITVQQMVIAGLMLGLITIFKILGRVLPKTPVGASWVEIYMIFALIMVLILPWAISLLVLILAPLVWFVTGDTMQTSPFSFMLDYSLPLLSVMCVCFAKFFSDKKNSKLKISKQQIAILLLILISCVVKWGSHTISGVISYNVPLVPSASLNAPFTFITMAISIVIVLPFLTRIKELQAFVNTQGMRW